MSISQAVYEAQIQRIADLQARLAEAQANECAWEATAQNHYEEARAAEKRLAESEAMLQLIAGHRQAVAFFAPQLAGVIAALDRIDAHLSRKEQP